MIDVDDERIKRRPLLRGENLRNGLRIKRIRRQAVNGLGWQGHSFPSRERVDGSAGGFFE